MLIDTIQNKFKTTAYWPLVISCMFAGIALRGWVLASFWRWFIMPVWPVAPVSWVQFMGVSVMVTALVYLATESMQYNVARIHTKLGADFSKEDRDAHVKYILSVTFSYVLFWVLGGIIKLFMGLVS